MTRSWVSEKTVDELSLVREPTKTVRSYSVTESLASPSTNVPPIIGSVSLTTRDSSGSMTSSSSNSRPLSLEDELAEGDELERKASVSNGTGGGGGGGFWPFGRKASDAGSLLKPCGSNESFGTMQRSPRHFSFEELSSQTMVKSQSFKHGTVMQREGSQNSLSIFRKDFWKPAAAAAAATGTTTSNRNPLLNFNSDPSLLVIQRKGSSASLVHPSPSSSTDTNELTQFQKKLVVSPHPLDTGTPLSEVSSFNWDQ